MIALKQAYQGRVDASQIIDWARDNMAAYKVPRIIELTDALPKSAKWEGEDVRSRGDGEENGSQQGNVPMSGR